MSIAAWRWYHLILFWVISGILFVVLVTQQLLAEKKGYTLAFSGRITGIRKLFLVLWALCRVQPLLALLLVGIPLIMIGVSVYWGVATSR